jgi:hypothetical protein
MPIVQLDPSLINSGGGVNSFQNAFANALKMRASQQEVDDNQYKMDAIREDRGQQNALAQLLANQGFDPKSAQGQAQMYGAGGVKNTQGYLKSQSDIAETSAKTNKEMAGTRKVDLENYLQKFDIMDRLMSPVKDQYSYDVMRQQAAKDPLLADMATNMPAIYEPEKIAAGRMQAMSIKEKIAAELAQSIANETGRSHRANEKISVDNNTANNATSRLNNQESNATSRANNSASVGASYANAGATRAVAASNVEAARMRRDQDTEMKLGDDYRAQSKGFKEVGDAYKQINATLDKASASPAATLAAATKFMKMLDPGSVVRESELGMALAASGVLDRAANYHNVLLKGKVLTPSQVTDFKNITGQIYSAAQTGQKAIDKDYTGKANAYKLRPEMIVQDLGQNATPIGDKGKSSDIDALLNKYK